MNNRKTLVIGLTGQTGAGKSTVCRMFADHEINVIDADIVARDTIEHSKACLMDLVLEFSTEVIHPDATLNRQKLAEICFGNREKLKKLNEITFPYIIEEIAHKLDQACAQGKSMVLLDAPTLYESGLDKRCDHVVAVIAEKELRIQRIIKRDSMTLEAAERRANAQNNDEFYTVRADDVIVNSEDMDMLRFNFMVLYDKLEKMARDGFTKAETPAAPDRELPEEGVFEELDEQE